MEIIILSQLIAISALITIYKYKTLIFNNVFNLVSTAIVLAFIPNFLTSLLLSTNSISAVQSQVEFGITGSIATLFLWYVLKDLPC